MHKKELRCLLGAASRLFTAEQRKLHSELSGGMFAWYWLEELLFTYAIFSFYYQNPQFFQFACLHKCLVGLKLHSCLT